jgi:hypothetical protein
MVNVVYKLYETSKVVNETFKYLFTVILLRIQMPNFTINLIEKRQCPECEKELPDDRRIKYCSRECEYEARKKYMADRMRKLRAQRWTEEMSKRMGWLKENQQFAENITLDKCWVCGSKENLQLHHVKYYPECITRVLCKSCSEFLHKSLLRGKRCRPKIIK